MNNASYYMKRIVYGLYEPDNSVIKKVASTMLKNSREKIKSSGYRHIIQELENNNRHDFNLSKSIKSNLLQQNVSLANVDENADIFSEFSRSCKNSKLAGNIRMQQKAEADAKSESIHAHTVYL